MQLRKNTTAARNQPWVVATVMMTLCGVSEVRSQDQRAPLPPPLPHIVQRDSGQAPMFELADPALSDAASQPAQPPSGLSSAAYTPAISGESMSVMEGTPPPILGSLADYLHRREDEEIQQLQSLKLHINQLAKIIREHQQRQEEARDSVARARKREQAALQTAREAQERDRLVEAQKQELRRLMEELERREQILRRQQREHTLTTTPAGNPQTPPNSPTEAQDMEPAAQQGPPTNVSSRSEFSGSSKPTAVPITAAAVDERALADNLFGAAEYKLAADIYQQLLGQQPDSSEAAWFRLQTANCYRHLGNHELAASYYREVVADASDAFLADTAQWWLAALGKRQTIHQRTKELAMLMDQVSQQLDEDLK